LNDEGTAVLEDGWGNLWVLCSDECDLEVVRPGKAQCSGKCEALEGWLREPDPWETHL
jgi:hypothetical protein